ncbi:hypothetical protein BC831DRAFT_437458 [Entophlyctis helioformis]|nr:hypothetical protein BC831DRAFT_437458 [Entophlyctis helioformis]
MALILVLLNGLLLLSRPPQPCKSRSIRQQMSLVTIRPPPVQAAQSSSSKVPRASSFNDDYEERLAAYYAERVGYIPHHHDAKTPSKDRDERRSYAKEDAPAAVDPNADRKSPSPQLDSFERDRRTVFCMQLAARLRSKELTDFFKDCGRIRDVKLVTDKNTGRSKGVGYVEFYEVSSVPKAITMSGQKLLGIPIIVQHTESEKNRLAEAAAASKIGEVNTNKLFVGSLSYSLTSDELRAAFEPFGALDHCSIQMDPRTGRSKGSGYVHFKNPEDARRAVEKLNGFNLMGRTIRVSHITEKPAAAAGRPEYGAASSSAINLDDGDMEGVSMSSLSRADLMAKLARRDQPAQPVAPVAPKVVLPAMETRCVLLKNMFDPSEETEPGWAKEIEEDVRDECTKFGKIVHVAVDADSAGHVYLKFAALESAQQAIKTLHGRFFAGKTTGALVTDANDSGCCTQIEALHVADQIYHLRFPGSASL